MKIRLFKSGTGAALPALLAGGMALLLAAPVATAQEREREHADHEEREGDRDRDRDREGEREHAEHDDGCKCGMCQEKAAARKREEAAKRKDGDHNREVGEHMMAMMREMRELNRNGHHEEASRIGEKLRAMMQEHPEVGRKVRAEMGAGPMGSGPRGPMAGGPGPQGGPPPMMLERIERALNEARERGDEEMVAQLEKKMQAAREMMQQRPPHPPEPEHREGDEVANRVRHLHEAAAHLDAAGMHELAGRIRQEAREIEIHHHEGHGPGPDRLQRQLEEMREALETLHREIREISEEIDD